MHENIHLSAPMLQFNYEGTSHLWLHHCATTPFKYQFKGSGCINVVLQQMCILYLFCK